MVQWWPDIHEEAVISIDQRQHCHHGLHKHCHHGQHVPYHHGQQEPCQHGQQD